MTIEPIRIPSDLCLCGHWMEDHEPMCIVVEDLRDWRCTDFTPDDEDNWGYWFTDDEGQKLEGRA